LVSSLEHSNTALGGDKAAAGLTSAGLMVEDLDELKTVCGIRLQAGYGA
jgi:hypothetical protein